MAGNTTSQNIEGFIYNAMNAVYQANLSFTSQNFGGKKYSRINRIMVTCLGVVTAVGLGDGNSGLSLRTCPDSDLLLGSGGHGIRNEKTCGLWNDIFPLWDHGYDGGQHPRSRILRHADVRLPSGSVRTRIVWIFTVFQVYHNLTVLYLSYPFTWIVTATAHMICFYIVRRKLRGKMRDKQHQKNPTNADLTRKETTELKRYKKYITPYLSAFVIGPLMMLTEVAGEVMLPKFMSMIINNGVASRNVAYIGKMGTLMVLTVLFMAVGGILGAYFSAKASISFTSDMRNDLFRKVQQFSFENIDGYSTGSLVTRLTNDVQQVQNVLMMGLRMALRAPGMFLGALIMAFMMNRQLAVIILIVIPLLLAAIILILKTAFPRFGEMQRRLDRLNSGIQESLTNVRVVKSFVREDHEIEKFSRLNRDLKESSLRALRIVITTMPVMMFAMNVTTLAVVWYGGNIIIAGKMPVGDLTAFTTYIVQILMSP